MAVASLVEPAAASSTRSASKSVNPAPVMAMILIVAAIAFDFLAPLLNS